MALFNLNTIGSALSETNETLSGVDFTGKSLKLDTADDARPIIDAINLCPRLDYLTLTGNTLGVEAAKAIAKALETHPELKLARWADMFTGRMKTEIPPALKALGDGMIAAGARLSLLDLSDNAFGPIGVEGLAKLLESEVCSQLQELRLNNNGLGITGGKLLGQALSSSSRPRLRIFVAGRNRLENDGAKALAKVFRSMGSLEEISMPQNGIYHPGVKALSDAFKCNPALRSLNLNDNTVGSKGAEAIAEALPKLKHLSHVNFGDCLLKSKGASTLAKAFKEHSVPLQSLDLSHNEIGREACMEVVDSITYSTNNRKLTRVVLAGNSLGGTAKKNVMKNKLGGDVAELSEGDDSAEEYVTGSEEEESGSEGEEEESGHSEDSATEDAQQDKQNSQQEVRLDDSGLEEVVSDVAKFLENPSLTNMRNLGSNPVDVIDTHLQNIKEPAKQVQSYVEATLALSGLALKEQSLLTQAKEMYSLCMKRVAERPAMQWMLANHMLIGLGLIKSEDKHHKINWDLPACYSVLKAVIDEAYFPRSLADTLRFFIQSKRESLCTKYGLDLSGGI